MTKCLITGRQGTGKTTVIAALSKRGYTAYNTDDQQGVTGLQNKHTGKLIDWPDGAVDWNSYAWNWQEEPLKALLASDPIVFVGAVTSNQLDFYQMFDRVFVLTIDEAELRTRLSTHEHPSHHVPGELDRIAHNHFEKQQLFIDEGAEPVSAGRPVDDVVDDILKRLNLSLYI